MIARGRKISADDYPEHLNPFADDDIENVDLRNNRFNTTGRRRARPSLKDAWESNPSAALDVAVPVRGPTPARPPPPRLSLSPPPPPPSEVQKQQPTRPLTQPPPPAPAPAPDAAPAGSNWTLADGGFPQRFPSYRPKKRRAPPPPPAAAPPPTTAELPATAAVTTPVETRDTTSAEQHGEVVSAGAETVEVGVGVRVTLEPATPPPSSPGEAAAGQQRSEAQDQHQQRQAAGGAPLAQGEDDGEAQAEAEAEGGGPGEPSGAAAADQSTEPPAPAEADHSTEPPAPAEAEQSTEPPAPSVAEKTTEPPAPADAAPPPAEPAEVDEGRGAEPAEKSAQGSDSAQLAAAAEGEAAPPPESSTSEEAAAADSPQGLALTIRVYKEDTVPSPEEPQVSQGGDAEGGTGESLQVVEPTVEVELKLEAAGDPEPATATAGDTPLTETDAKEPQVDGVQELAPGESSRAALAAFREDYLTSHYKGGLPVLQITESDLADEKEPGEREEGPPVQKPSAALPVLHISEEDLRGEPAAGGSSVAASQGDGGATPSPRGSPDSREESPQPQPQPRQSSAQELNSRIYFRVLPPLAGGAAGGGPPQLKTFAPPTSPPGRGPKPQPPLRNGVAAAASGDASPPRTKSPLPTPRRRHQTAPRDA